MSKKVKSITLTKYDYLAKNIHAKELEVKGWKYSYAELDENGNATIEIKYDLNGKVEDKSKNTFDKSGNLIEEITYLDGREIAEHKTYERDENGKILKAYKHYHDKTKDTINYEYDSEGQLEKITIVDSYGEVESVNVIKYESGRVILNEKYEYDELIEKEVFVYDKNGNLTENEKWAEESGSVKYKNSYDDKNNLLKELVYNKDDKLVAKSEYIYNDDNKIAEVREESQQGTNTTKIKFDSSGNAIEQVETNSSGEINNSVERSFDEDNRVEEAKVFIDFHGKGINQQYVLKYEYNYY